jgi:hypothetical protein
LLVGDIARIDPLSPEFKGEGLKQSDDFVPSPNSGRARVGSREAKLRTSNHGLQRFENHFVAGYFEYPAEGSD